MASLTIAIKRINRCCGENPVYRNNFNSKYTDQLVHLSTCQQP